jgi:hypothetical protein
MIIGGIAPMSVVVTVSCGPDGQKSDRIHEIADPRVPGYIVVHRILAFEIDLPFLILDTNNELKLRSTILRLPTWKAISGLVEDWNAMGDDMEKGVILKPGSVFVLPANHIHHTWTTDEEVILQIYFTGPGGLPSLIRLTIREKKPNNRTTPDPHIRNLSRLNKAFYWRPKSRFKKPPSFGRRQNGLYDTSDIRFEQGVGGRLKTGDHRVLISRGLSKMSASSLSTNAHDAALD